MPRRTFAAFWNIIKELPNREVWGAAQSIVIAFTLFVIAGVAFWIPYDRIQDAKHEASKEDRASLNARVDRNSQAVSEHSKAIMDLIARTKVGDADRERAIQILATLNEQFEKRTAEHAYQTAMLRAIANRSGVTEAEIERAKQQGMPGMGGNPDGGAGLDGRFGSGQGFEN